MANYNGARFLEVALRSVMRQTLADLEVIVVDDASTDDSVRRIEQAACEDQRIRLLRREISGGPGAARNMALDAARGEWLAVIDSDDLIHPERLGKLVARAEADDADIVIDDLLIFFTDGSAPRTLFHGRLAHAPQWIDLAWYIRSNRLFGAEPPLGVSKPLIRRRKLVDAAVRYDEALPVAEDHDLVARLLLAGLRMRAYPELDYFYRKHDASISHRLDLPRIDAMIANAARFRAAAAGAPPTVVRAQDIRDRSLAQARAFTEIVEALKTRKPDLALGIALRHPSAAWMLRHPLVDRIAAQARRWSRVAAPAERDVVVLSQQRVIGATNGSSTYLLALCRALAAEGRRLTFIGPSPNAFGSWPALPLRREMSVFQAIRLRGGLRLGGLILARRPGRWAGTLRAAITATLARFDFGRPSTARPAVGAPSAREDLLFIARHARGARLILADYAFATPLAAYTLSPGAPVAVVMHDLFSARAAQFANLAGSDTVAALSADAEAALLGQADLVLAIQQTEATQVRAWLPRTPVAVTPLAVEARGAPSPGSGARILFVGSNTAPNVTGLEWFFAEVWPRIIAYRPDAELLVAGNVSRGLTGPAPARVSIMGPVADLGGLYDSAAVVISPLIAGSGLKIKLIEALGLGKAVVATSVTLQGVEDSLGAAVVRADEPVAFADGVLGLLNDPAARVRLIEHGLAAIAEHFSPAASYAGLLELARQHPPVRL